MFILSGVSSYLWYLYCMYIVLQSKLLFPTIFVIYKISFFPTASDILRSKNGLHLPPMFFYNNNCDSLCKM